MIGVLEPGEYREVMIFSGANPVFRKPGAGGSHRPGQDHQYSRRDFSIHDPENGVTYHASHTVSKPGLGSPRHHHSFEQIRFVLSGEHEYGGKRFGAGWLGYFPEGVYYGPQAQLTDSSGFVMQFPGMEAIYGKEAAYPPPAYSEQIWINTENMAWQPSEIPGVSVKRLGYFNQRGPAAQMIKMASGAAIPAGTTGAFMIRYIFEGEAVYGGETLPTVTNLYYPPDAAYEGMSTSTGATILSIELQAQIPGTTVAASEPPLPYRI